MLKAVILDMDGVMVDSECCWEKVEYDLLKSLVPNWDKTKHRSVIGMSPRDIYQYLKINHNLKIQKDEFIRTYDKIAYTIYKNEVKVYPKLIDFIKKIKQNKLKIGICSSSPRGWIDLVVNRFDLFDYIDKIVSSEDIPGKGKPNPEIYLKIIEELKVRKKEVLVIEDSKKGIQAAKSAGLYCIGFKNGFNNDQDLNKADSMISSFSNILDINKLTKNFH